MRGNIFQMLKKKKSIYTGVLFVFFVAVVFYQSVLLCHAADGDEIRASKKIISVVYDDSGSMIGKRWSFSNYSFQALTALLNEQDELYVTYMSDPYNSVKMDTSNIENTVKNVRDWNKSGGTPVEAVDTAKSKLDSINESDSSTQFWLVIFTDGEMFDTSGLTSESVVQSRLDSFKGNVMSNSTHLNVVYLGMPGALEMTEDPTNGLYTYLVENDTEIVNAINEIANMVSGRLKADKVSQINKKTISVTSSLPIYSLSILSQRSSATIVKAEYSGQKLNVERNISLDAIKLQNGEKIPTLYGNAGIINSKDSKGLMTYIPAGTYTVFFLDDVDINDMTIQYEPAISMMTEIQRNGVKIDDYSVLEEGDIVDIKLLPVIPGTDTVISVEDLPKQINWKVEYEVDGQLIDSYQGDSLVGAELKKGNNVIRGFLTIPGYAPLISETQFDISEHIEVIEVIHDYGIKVYQPDNTTYLRNDFKHDFLDSGNTIRFSITEDGIPMSLEELNDANLHLAITDIHCNPSKDFFTKILGWNLASCKLEQTDNGEYLLIVKRPGIMPVIFLKAGDYKVTVAIQENSSKSNYGSFSVDKAFSWSDIIIPLLILAILLYIIYYVFIKKKFKGQTVYYEDWEIVGRGNGNQIGETMSKRLGFFSGFKLFGPNSIVLKNVKLVADSDGIIIDGKSIAKAVAAYGDSALQPTTSLRMISKQLADTKDEEGKRVDVPDQYLSEEYLYFQDSKSVGMLWRINMNG